MQEAPRILVGTASWTDKSLLDSKRFYPPEARTAEARLRFYATQFPMVEVDSSYYAIPTAATAQHWALRTPRDFVFNVKAFRLFTGHQTPPVVLPKDIKAALGAPSGTDAPMLFYRDVPSELRDALWQRFIEALQPLAAVGKLAAVHFQFPPWVRCDAEGRALVMHCVERMAGFMVSVEFRHASWFDDAQRNATIAFERELGVVHTVVDGPQGFHNSVPQVWETAHPRLAILRLHGRNSETWNKRGLASSAERFNHDYTEAQLASLVEPLRQLSRLGAATHVIFNNNMEDQGQRNARSLMQLLGPDARAPQLHSGTG